MQIQIDQKFGQIGIDTTRPQLQVNSRPVDIQTQIIRPRMDFSVQFPRVQIDLTRPQAELGCKGIVPFEAEYANKGKAAVLRRIGRVAGEGDTLARSIGSGAEVIGQIARAKSIDNAQSNIGLLPRSAPEISASGGLDIRVMPGDVRYSVTPHHPEIKYSPGDISIYLRQKSVIKIETAGTHLDVVA